MNKTINAERDELDRERSSNGIEGKDVQTIKHFNDKIILRLNIQYRIRGHSGKLWAAIMVFNVKEVSMR